MPKLAGALLFVALTVLALGAWWTMLAAERAAIRANEDGARTAAVAAAVAIGREAQSGGDVRGVVALAQQAGDLRLEVRDSNGTRIAGAADMSPQRVVVDVPGTSLTVATEVDRHAGLGLGRYSHVVTAVAFLVMALSVTMLVIVARQRRRAEAEVARLGQRWEEAAAADDLTGLGNRMRLLEDTETLIARGTRYGNSFGLALFDLQGDPSDTTVRTVSELIAGEARGADLCYRVGHGRFVTLLPEQDETGAAVAAERIRLAIADRLRQAAGTGVAAFTPWLPCSASDLLVRAELDLGAAALAGDRGADRYAARQMPVPTHSTSH